MLLKKAQHLTENRQHATGKTQDTAEKKKKATEETQEPTQRKPKHDRKERIHDIQNELDVEMSCSCSFTLHFLAYNNYNDKDDYQRSRENARND